MNKRKYGVFSLPALFYIKNTSSIQKKDVDLGSGNIPYVTASNVNNGVMGHIAVSHNTPMESGNSIMIGGKTLTITYQEHDYVSNDSHNLSLTLKNERYREREIYLFLIASMIKALSPKYSWGNSISYKKIQKDTIVLPSHKQYRPDWASIDRFSLSLSLSSEEEWDAIMSKIDTSQWKPFNYQDFFELETVSTKLTKMDLDDNGTVPVYSSDSSNNGCIGHCNKEPHFKVSNERPVYVLFGDHTRTLNIVTSDFCVKDNVKVLVPKISNINTLLFVIASWKKAIPELGYARHWSVAKDATILLPAIEEDVPDWDYMAERIQEMEAERIQEMEAERIQEMEAYLAASGLDNTELTDAEQEAVTIFDSLLSSEPQRFKSVPLHELFKKIKTRKLQYKAGDLSKEPFENSVPVLTASNDNQGLTRYIDKNVLDDEDILTNKIVVIANGDCTAFYQTDDFVVLQDAYALEYLGEKLDMNMALYLTGCLQKLIRASFNWNNKAGWNKIQDLEIMLPITEDEAIDYDYINTFMGGGSKGNDKQGEQTAINRTIGSPQHHIFAQLTIDTLFAVESSKKSLNANTLSFKETGTPYVTRTAQNNGRQGYIDRPANEHMNAGNVLTFGMDVNVCFYQPDDFAVGNRVKLLVPEGWMLNEQRALFIVGQVNKAFEHINWGDTCNTKTIQDSILHIPTDEYGVPDWNLIETYITAQEKIAIEELNKLRGTEIKVATHLVSG